MKATVLAYLCLAAQLYFCWALVRAKSGAAASDGGYKVEITVYGPDGKIIPAIRPR
jgi:hypothetical protein